MAAQPLPLSTPATRHDAIIRTAMADGASNAWAMLRLARTNMAAGHLVGAGLCLVVLSGQARTARAPVARLIRRDLPGLAGMLAVAIALASPPAPGAALPLA